MEAAEAEPFYQRTVQAFLRNGALRNDEKTLVVGGGQTDHDILRGLGFTDVTLTNIDVAMPRVEHGFVWARQDAEALTFDDKSFDQVIVHQALHHCASPHRALTEMYRVARRTVLAIEPRDTLIQRLAERIGLGARHEIEAVAANGMTAGGYRGGPVPNFVYRWTPREVAKTLATYDPTGPVLIHTLTGVRVPRHRIGMQRSWLKRAAGMIASEAARLAATLLPSQRNLFAFCAQRPHSRFPWVTDQGLDEAWTQARVHAMSPRLRSSESTEEIAARACVSTVAPPLGGAMAASTGSRRT